MFSFFDIDKNNSLDACVATIGNFDGVHKAHKKLITHCVQSAKERKLPSVALTFDPHPSEIFLEKPIIPLIDTEQKLKRIKALGIDYTYVIPFTKELAKQKAQEFISNILIDFLHCKELIVGYNFSMGSDMPKSHDLEKMLNKFGCKLTLEEKITFLHADGELSPISSTSIRNELAKGNIKTVNNMLGHRHIVYGHVEHGAKRGGSQLGFPTANLDTGALLLPKPGVYATSVFFPNKDTGKEFKAISNVGYNPTFEGKKLLLESYILDFSQEIYGEKLKVAFIERIRDERKFNSIQELIAQLTKDKEYRQNM